MKLLKLDDSISRFRFAQSCIGLAGCLCVCYAIWTPFWLKGRGLWTKQEWNTSRIDLTNSNDGKVFNALEAEQVFAVLSFLMAVSTSALCPVFALCWTSETVRSYSNTRSLLMAGTALYPTTLLLLTMLSTGFFFLFSWFLLMVVEMIVFLAEQIVVPDIIPDLERSVEVWRAASQLKSNPRSFSDGYYPCARSKLIPKRYMSDP